jgi:polar amino acid transport system ATP-binding protein
VNISPLLSLSDISKGFGERSVLHNISFGINKAEVIVILGRSGTGKTTLLRIMNTLIKPDSGNYFFHGERVIFTDSSSRYLRTKIGFVFQRFNLFSHLNVLRNISLGLIKVKKMEKLAAEEAAKFYLEKVGLSDRMHSFPYQLSGGQQQRVGIARALALEPEVLLFDEPTSALDPFLAKEVIDVIRSLSQNGCTMVVVTHDLRLANHIASRIMLMDGGKIVCDTSPHHFYRSEDRLIREFLSQVS